MKINFDKPEKHITENFILLADDDEDDRFLMNEFFKKNGYKCTTLNSGLSAVRFLQSLSSGSYPALILLDYTMPLLSGEEVLVFIKKEDQLKDIPVIIYSSEMNEHLKSRLEALGAYMCFSKYYHANQLNKLKDAIETAKIHLGHLHLRIS